MRPSALDRCSPSTPPNESCVRPDVGAPGAMTIPSAAPPTVSRSHQRRIIELILLRHRSRPCRKGRALPASRRRHRQPMTQVKYREAHCPEKGSGRDRQRRHASDTYRSARVDQNAPDERLLLRLVASGVRLTFSFEPVGPCVRKDDRSHFGCVPRHVNPRTGMREIDRKLPRRFGVQTGFSAARHRSCCQSVAWKLLSPYAPCEAYRPAAKERFVYLSSKASRARLKEARPRNAISSLIPPPTKEANTTQQPIPAELSGGAAPVEGRPPGPIWPHQRWEWFAPKAAVEVTQEGAKM